MHDNRFISISTKHWYKIVKVAYAFSYVLIMMY